MEDKKGQPALKELTERLQSVRKIAGSKQLDTAERRRGSRNLALGMRVAAEMLASLVVGGGIGWVVDGLLGTKPWLFLVFLVLGLAAGFRGVYRVIQMVSNDAKD